MIIRERQGDIEVLKMNFSVTNPINWDMFNEMNAVLQELENDDEVRALVLTSSNEKFFSIGLDIPSLFGFDNGKFQSFLQAFNQLCIDLYSYKKPTIAAVNGHAIAGGAVLALCCDYRYVTDGKLMGLNEIKLGLPLPYPIDRITNQVCGNNNAMEIMKGGEFYKSDDLLRLRMATEILEANAVLPSAMERAQSLTSKNPIALQRIKKNRTEPVVKQILSKLKEEEQFFIDCWYSDYSQPLLKAAAEKF